VFVTKIENQDITGRKGQGGESEGKGFFLKLIYDILYISSKINVLIFELGNLNEINLLSFFSYWQII
jgi:hypothetical protein